MEFNYLVQIIRNYYLVFASLFFCIFLGQVAFAQDDISGGSKVIVNKREKTKKSDRVASEAKKTNSAKSKDNSVKQEYWRNAWEGEWKGTLYQQPGGTQKQFTFSLKIKLIGKTVSGISRISVITSPTYYGVINLKGEIREDEFLFKETSIREQKTEPGTSWCIKSGRLKLVFNAGRLNARGNWKASACSPGTIVLEKVSD